jgi:hypothetical protein
MGLMGLMGLMGFMLVYGVYENPHIGLKNNDL